MRRTIAYPGWVFDKRSKVVLGSPSVNTPRRYEMTTPTQIYNVPGVSCEHCRTAITQEVSAVAGVESVAGDLDRKVVVVGGHDVDGAAVRAAIDDAGYDVAD
jgi:copper chaperone